jgi:AcrR family transcriptional regulator
MNASRTARERVRAELTHEIKAAARRQLAAEGADRLSLRAVARELGMVSSAVYRYFPSRDDLLTALIIDAYDAVGSAAEAAVAAATGPRDGWRAACHAIRGWARRHPHEYALIYGSPVPGYAAPRDTVGPASRIPLLLVRLVRDAWEAGTLRPAYQGEAPDAELTAQLAAVAAELVPGLPPAAMNAAFLAWTQLFGMLSFELFGQLVGSVDPSDAFFAHAVTVQADLLGLPG